MQGLFTLFVKVQCLALTVCLATYKQHILNSVLEITANSAYQFLIIAESNTCQKRRQRQGERSKSYQRLQQLLFHLHKPSAAWLG